MSDLQQILILSVLGLYMTLRLYQKDKEKGLVCIKILNVTFLLTLGALVARGVVEGAPLLWARGGSSPCGHSFFGASRGACELGH